MYQISQELQKFISINLKNPKTLEIIVQMIETEVSINKFNELKKLMEKETQVYLDKSKQLKELVEGEDNAYGKIVKTG